MYKIFIIVILFVSVNIGFTQDTVAVDSEQVDTVFFIKKKKQVLITIPFNQKNIDKLKRNKQFVYKTNQNNFKSYLFLFLLNLIGITVFLFNFSKSRVKKLSSTLFSINSLIQHSKSESKRESNYLLAYTILSVLFLIVFVYLVANNATLRLDTLKIGIGLFVFILLDIFIHNISAFLYNLNEENTIIHFNNYTFGILLLPFLIVSDLVLIFFDSETTIAFATGFFVLLVIFYLLKEIRNFMILKAKQINVFSFYFFLYLCTFKILPLVVFIKILYDEFVKN